MGFKGSVCKQSNVSNFYIRNVPNSGFIKPLGKGTKNDKKLFLIKDTDTFEI